MPAASARKMGTWKLAYADFLTALCAFFLIMWIVHGVTAGERQALAQQFGSKAESVELASNDPVLQAKSVAQLLRADPAFQDYGASVTITAEPNLVRIDLSDMTEKPLFDTGDGSLNATGEQLTRLTGQAISFLAFPVMIEGHTDSNPSLTDGYSNWELSADRANSARRLLLDAGVSEDRIKSVAGLADTRPLLQDAPTDGANRRISIVLVINEKTA
ncbi:MAG: flagellar motor protein MotB [Pseudomonadota bacterium]|nr:flagellar motor protein MotB [Pseudomonadota bacterium]